MDKVQKATIQLIRYILTGDVPVIDTDMDFEALYDFSRSHGVECMVYDALKKLNVPIPQSTANKFENAYIANVMIDTVQTEALKEITQAFENAGIDHIPLKGSVVKFLYPMPHYRKCGDIDILIKPEDEKLAKKVLLSNGYALDGLAEYEHHHGYRKGSVVLIELHKKMMEQKTRGYEFFSDIWSNAVAAMGKKHEYVLSQEYIYAFTIAHFAKHIKKRGAGIKFVADVFVLKDKCVFNDDVLKAYLLKANMRDIERLICELESCWFTANKFDIEDEEVVLAFQEFIFESGSYGNKEQRKRINSSGFIGQGRAKRILYILKNGWFGVFAPYDHMRGEYPILLRFKIALPVCWLLRIVKIILNGELKKRMMSVLKTDSDNKKYREIWKAVN